jgi:hypothetical protein
VAEWPALEVPPGLVEQFGRSQFGAVGAVKQFLRVERELPDRRVCRELVDFIGNQTRGS